MTKKVNDKEARKQNRLEKLGDNHPACVLCGEDDSSCLEQHHIAGKDYGDDLSIVCRNCHSKLSDSQKDHPRQLGKPPTTNERIGRMLLGLADLFELLVERLREFGLFLIQSVQPAVGA